MSAYLVSHATINVILTMLQVRDGETLTNLFRTFTAPADPRDALDSLGRLLLGMNVDALRACYPSHSHDDEAAEAAAYTFSARPTSTAYAAKQLDCYLYQCSEGDVPDRPLFAALKTMRVLLVDRVLENVPAYASAPWGITT